MRRGVLLVALVALALVAGCAPKPTLEAAWPRADRERGVGAVAAVQRWPLTGLPTAGETLTLPRPVLVTLAGPSTPGGVDAADLVWEIAMPAAASRLLPIFQSDLPPHAIGPVAKASGVDAAVARAFGAALAYAGPSPLSSPTTWFADAGANARKDAYSRGAVDLVRLGSVEASSYAPAAAFSWSETAPQGGQDIADLKVPVGSGGVSWRWDAKSGAYVRRVPGGSSGGVRAVNVVVLWSVAISRPGADVAATEGRVSVFRGGRKYTGRWTGYGSGSPPIVDAQGQALPLAPGDTWFEVVPNDADIAIH